MDPLDFMNKNAVDNDFTLFSNWMNKIFNQKLPENINAFNFNIYEGVANTYDIQLIGTNKFDENDKDWANSDYFTTGEDVCYIDRNNFIKKTKDGVIYIQKLINKYLESGKYSGILKNVKVIGVCLLDDDGNGDIEIIYKS